MFSSEAEVSEQEWWSWIWLFVIFIKTEVATKKCEKYGGDTSGDLM